LSADIKVTYDDGRTVEVHAVLTMGAYLSNGHKAVTIAMDDHFRLVEVGLDGDALAAVTFTAKGTESKAVVALSDDGLGRLLAEGAQVVEIGAPPSSVDPMWWGVGWGSTYVVVVHDKRRFGHLSASRLMTRGRDRRTAGAILQHYYERSGVDQVNERRRDVMRQLYREYGNERPDLLAEKIAMGARVEAIISWHMDYIVPEWQIRGNDGGLISASSPQLEPDKRTADYVIDYLSTEVYGGTRVTLPCSQGWQTRLVSDSQSNDHGATHNTRSHVHEHLTPAGRTDNHKPRLMSRWTLKQRGDDATAELAAALADGTLPIPVALADGHGAAYVVDIWRSIGLGKRQIQVMLLTELGYTETEIGDVLKIAKSTVRNTRAAARKKIFRNQ
jgi:hypothetical protein